MSATATFRSVTAVLSELVLVLQSVKWTPPEGPEETAFQIVRLFDSDNLSEAFRELLLSQQRICLVVPTNEEYVSESEGELQFYRRELSVALVISDRVLGSRQAALFGEAALGTPQGRRPNPGAHLLKDLALPAITGELLANPGGVTVIPVDSNPITVKASPDTKDDKLKNLPGRAAIVLQLLCRGGQLESQQSSVGPIV